MGLSDARQVKEAKKERVYGLKEASCKLDACECAVTALHHGRAQLSNGYFRYIILAEAPLTRPDFRYP
jgi:hypothetical protein